jgi:phage recombination protein Bet
MTNSIQIAAQSAIGEWNPSQLEIIKQQIAKGCSDAELSLFGQVCKRTGLDPFSKQIYAINRGGKMTIQLSIDGLRTIAARSGLYGGSKTEWCGDDGIWHDVWLSNKPPAAAKTTVHRIGSPSSFTGVARYGAYQQGNTMWSKMPDVMIGKCSESIALRKAFPAELSGLYSSEEMEQADDSTVKYPDNIKHCQEALKDCIEILGWNAEQKAAWAKAFCPRPFAEWTILEWEKAVVLIHEEIDAQAVIEVV